MVMSGGIRGGAGAGVSTRVEKRVDIVMCSVGGGGVVLKH